MNDRLRNRLKRIVLLTSGVTVMLLLYPVEYRSTRFATLAGLFITFAGALCLSWRSKLLRAVLILFGIIPFVFLCLPARDPDTFALRSEYLRLLRTFESTRYVWGGESYLGIDCSGLVRKPLIIANLSEGLRTVNGSQLRNAIFLWWQDASARALGNEYRGLTMRVSTEPSINAADYSDIQPGDLAVTMDGVHVLAYLGNKEWIQADPNLNRVVRLTVPANNPWFDVPVHLTRWQMLPKE